MINRSAVVKFLSDLSIKELAAIVREAIKLSWKPELILDPNGASIFVTGYDNRKDYLKGIRRAKVPSEDGPSDKISHIREFDRRLKNSGREILYTGPGIIEVEEILKEYKIRYQIEAKLVQSKAPEPIICLPIQ